MLPAKFHLAGRNDPREQSKIMEIEFKPSVCSWWEFRVQVPPCWHPQDPCGSHLSAVPGWSVTLGGPGGDGAHLAVISIV